ncbi:MAG TPA: MFS transporter [Micrococcaceae bacterium]|nr:MFS transporter [Micrococcaceae bacterium]
MINADVHPSGHSPLQKSRSLNTRDMRRVLGSSFAGSIIEYYDFILYATAASLVFGKVFFSNLDPAFALFVSFATLAVGYLARPLGGVIFGHFGDRLGRKRMLVLSMLLMGASTTAIGILPTSAQAGILAPSALVLLRVVQGVAVGGEWGGATLMAVEHAPARKRGFAAAFANAGGPAGGLLATFMVSGVAGLTGNQFLVWGWRIPFLFSAVLIAIGLLIRLKVSESPIFKELEGENERRERMPILALLRNHRREVMLALIATLGFYACQGILTVWGISVAIEKGVNRTGALNWMASSAIVTIVVCFLSARLSDRIGRRAVLTAAGILAAVLAFPILMLLTNGTLWGFAVAILMGNGLVQGAIAGPLGAFISEQFPTDVRYTGASLAYQGGSTIGAGFTPMIASGLMVLGGGAAWLVGIFWILVLLVGAAAARKTPESSARRLEES